MGLVSLTVVLQVGNVVALDETGKLEKEGMRHRTFRRTICVLTMERGSRCFLAHKE